MIISVKRNFLELKNINDLIKKDKPKDNYSVKKIKPDFQLNKFFYKQIGKKYRWTDRLIWTDLQWSNYVTNKNLETYVIKNGEDLKANEYIFFDIAPNDIKYSSNVRFQAKYDIIEQIPAILLQFYDVAKFTTSDKNIKPQKRNDYED